MHLLLSPGETIKQNTEEWYIKRHSIITASDVSSILESNPFTTKYELLENKLKVYNEIKKIETLQTEWGTYHEPLARDIYSNLTLLNGRKKIHEIGLVIHKKYEWLGASPDGLIESLENNPEYKWWLLEIKCPYTRDIKNKGEKIPTYIWIQIQIQLEVCDLPFCHLFQCKFHKEDDKSTLIHKKMTTIYRDKSWFNEKALPQLQDFWDLMNKGKRYINFKNPFPNPKEWNSINSCSGFLLQDPIIDWLNEYKHKKEIKSLLIKYSNKIENNEDMYKQKKITFECIIDKLKLFSDNYIHIIDPVEDKRIYDFSQIKYKETLKAIKKDIDIIICPVLHNNNKQIYGVPDIIIKNRVAYSFLKKYKNVYGKQYLLQSGYTIFSTSVKDTFKNNCNLNKWENVIKNRYSGYINIVNKLTKKTNTNISFIGNTSCIVLNPLTIDKQCDFLYKGIEWIKNIKQNGEKWFSYLKNDKIPKVSNLMPNMCNKYDYQWRYIKKELAEKWGELTLLWYCGVNQRNRAHSNNIFSWKTDKESSTIVSSLYLKSIDENDFSYRKRIIKSMIDLNRSSSIYNCKDKDEIVEPFIDTDNALEVYIDFEILSKKNIYNIHSVLSNDIIYLIGLMWCCPLTNKMKNISFESKQLTLQDEKNMIQDWWNTIRDIKNETKKNKVILYHWSPAEKTFLDKALSRHDLPFIKEKLQSGKYELRDLMEMYIDAEVVIRGVWNYSLKDISKGLYNHGFIPEVWDDKSKGGDSILSGEKTIATATNCYKNSLQKNIMVRDNPMFKLIIDYNKMDCTVLYYLLLFLRKYIYNQDPRLKRRCKRKYKYENHDTKRQKI